MVHADEKTAGEPDGVSPRILRAKGNPRAYATRLATRIISRGHLAILGSTFVPFVPFVSFCSPLFIFYNLRGYV
jgi:hypothetical protein